MEVGREECDCVEVGMEKCDCVEVGREDCDCVEVEMEEGGSVEVVREGCERGVCFSSFLGMWSASFTSETDTPLSVGPSSH